MSKTQPTFPSATSYPSKTWHQKRVLKMQDQKMQDWEMMYKSAGLKNAKLENDRLENGLILF